jgi:hypothetical protein
MTDTIASAALKQHGVLRRIGVYHVSGPSTERQYKHIGLSDWRTLTETHRRRVEDAR